MNEDIEIVFHHRGKFVNDGTLKYEGETSTLSFDPDMWSYFLVVSVVKGLGYVGFKYLWYSIGEGSVLEDGLEPLIDDTSGIHMVNLARLNGQVHVFVVHVVSEPQVIHMLEYINDDEGEVEPVLHESNRCVENRTHFDGEVEGEGDVEQEVHECEGVVEEEVDVCSWSSSSDHGSLDGNCQWLEGLADVSVDCDIDGHIDVEWSSNVEVEVQSLSHQFSGPCSSEASHNNFDDNERGLSDDEWQFKELISGSDKDEEVNDNEGYGLQPFLCQKLRTIVDKHICNREFNLKLLDAKWLSKKLEKTVRENLKVKDVDIRENIQRKWNIGISRCMAYRVKVIASAQYKRIYDYAHELLARNPRSTVKVQVEDNEGEVFFKRFYACLKACKNKFVSCRLIIRLDGAFLKGKYGRELLTVVGRDANDQRFPIAYVVVEVENKDS
ncbi:uncharacterized protein LOC108327822 [Vigna angularis]|uniref:uncharacterized protein LOC108327822 n=1 Tax=Phaseolus angularis TaxID=3914 RepID=UPI00080A56B9|nr:uncharacterized protein LOC108327822 [Vigna angularis]